jgi:hypothetical protein
LVRELYFNERFHLIVDRPNIFGHSAKANFRRSASSEANHRFLSCSHEPAALGATVKR